MKGKMHFGEPENVGKVGQQRDYTDLNLRRAVRKLGFTGREFPLSTIAELVEHPNRPGEYEVLQYPNETRREAYNRLQMWARYSSGHQEAK